jgi:hypothetical protein
LGCIVSYLASDDLNCHCEASAGGSSLTAPGGAGRGNLLGVQGALLRMEIASPVMLPAEKPSAGSITGSQ